MQVSIAFCSDSRGVEDIDIELDICSSSSEDGGGLDCDFSPSCCCCCLRVRGSVTLLSPCIDTVASTAVSPPLLVHASAIEEAAADDDDVVDDDGEYAINRSFRLIDSASVGSGGAVVVQ